MSLHLELLLSITLYEGLIVKVSSLRGAFSGIFECLQYSLHKNGKQNKHYT